VRTTIAVISISLRRSWKDVVRTAAASHPLFPHLLLPHASSLTPQDVVGRTIFLPARARHVGGTLHCPTLPLSSPSQVFRPQPYLSHQHATHCDILGPILAYATIITVWSCSRPHSPRWPSTTSPPRVRIIIAMVNSHRVIW
jgi:hypothetical protein